MHLDAWTLLMQAFNFLVLCALLWRFLYRPVQAAIDRRLAEEERIRAEAAAARTAANGRTAELDARLQALTNEEAQRLHQASDQSAIIIQTAVDQAELEVAKIRARGLQDLAGERIAVQEDLQREAGRLALAVALRLIAPLATAIVHRQFVLALVDAVSHVSSERARTVAAQLATTGRATLLTSHGIDNDLREEIEASIRRSVGTMRRPLEIVRESTLLCGVELRLPGLTLAHHWTEQLQHALAEVEHAQPV